MPVLSSSQPLYNIILTEFDSLYLIQNQHWLELNDLLKSSDSSRKSETTEVQVLLDKMYYELNAQDSLIQKANRLVFPNYSKDQGKISRLYKLIDSTWYNFKTNLNFVNIICTRYFKFETDDPMKSYFDKIISFRLPYFKPKTVK